MKKISIANICAYLSLAISLVLILLWCSNAGGFKAVNLDSFVGVIVALLAIVVTLAIAWQIYNAVEMNRKIEDLNGLKSQFEEQKKHVEINMHKHDAHIFYLYSVGAEVSSLENSFRFMLYALEGELQLEEPVNLDIYLERMGKIVDKIVPNTRMEAELYDDIIDSDKKIRRCVRYGFVSSRYEQLFNQFKSKVVKA